MSGGIEVSPFSAADAPGVAALVADALFPDYPFTAESLVHMVRAIGAEDGAWWVARAGIDIVGWAQSQRCLEARARDEQQIKVFVDPNYRRRGLGGRLVGLAEQRALDRGGRVFHSSTRSGFEDGVRFLLGRGWDQVRTERLSALDPHQADVSTLSAQEQRARAAGYELVALRELTDRGRDLYLSYRSIEADVPRDQEYGGASYEEWHRVTFEDPLLELDGSVVVLAAGQPVALAWLVVNRSRGLAGNYMTGTLREHRRRGLGRLMKLRTIRWAQENGISRVSTSNDSNNHDMLELNRHLGYRPLPSKLLFSRTVASS
jgi:GNAT superfamily N-acetyltransferase